MDFKVIKAVIKGAITFIPFANSYINIRKRKKNNHSGSNALFCYTLWMKIITFLHNSNCPIKFESIAEIGPGGFLGLGFCALLTGSEKYTILEIEKNFNSNKNLQLFEEILSLFKENTSVPSYHQFEQINIKTDNFEYYNQIIDQSELNKYMSIERINKIRDSISASGSNLIECNFNWEQNPHVLIDFDMVFSRAVMEHVNSPEIVYKNIGSILKSDGIMLHDIEFHSHGITKSWHGHNDINDFVWSIIKGKRNYFQNRLNYNEHCLLMKKNNFKRINEIIVTKEINNVQKNIYGAAILVRKDQQN